MRATKQEANEAREQFWATWDRLTDGQRNNTLAWTVFMSFKEASDKRFGGKLSNYRFVNHIQREIETLERHFLATEES